MVSKRLRRIPLLSAACNCRFYYLSLSGLSSVISCSVPFTIACLGTYFIKKK